MPARWNIRIVTPLLLVAALAASGCMAMMGMHGWPGKEAHEADSAKAIATLRRMEELVSTQRILSATLPDSPEKQELLERLDQMKTEIQELTKTWEAGMKPSHRGSGGH